MSLPPADSVRVRVLRLAHAADLALPSYASDAAAGMDVRAAVTADVRLDPGAILLVPTGLSLQVPPGFEIQLRPRSGLAAKHGITLANSPATIDSDYRGEVFVALIHHGSAAFVIERGMRIAQMVLARAPRIVWEEAGELSPTVRGDGGFGHTGVS